MAPLVYFVRHGETDWNAEGRLQGQADTDLNDKGRAQAARNGGLLARLIDDPAAFDFVASPLRRTRETMEIVRAAMRLDPLAYRTDPRIMELNFGDWQGYTYAELDAASPGAKRSRARDKWNFVPPGATSENYARLADRVRPFIDELRRPTACVTHGGVLRVLFRIVGGLTEDACADLPVPQDRVLRWEDGALTWL